MVAFIEACRDQFGVEPVCRALRQAGVAISPSGYYAARGRPPPARAVRDAALEKQILRVYKDSGERYGAWKVWDQLNREGIAAARCTVERLMRQLGLRGVRRGGWKKPRTTVPDPSQDRQADLVNRDFAPDAPDRLWVVDFTFVATRAGTAYTAFVIDAFSRLIAGWRTAASHSTDLVLDALVMAVTYRARQGAKVAGLIHRSDAGSEGGFNRLSQHLDFEELRCESKSGVGWMRQAGCRCGPPAGRRWRGGRSGSGSGRRSGAACRARMPRWRPASRRRSAPGGSVRLVACGRSPRPPCRGVTCPLPSGRRSRSCGRVAAGCGRSPGGPPLGFDDLAGAAAQCRDPRRVPGVPGHDGPVARRPARPAPQGRQARRE